MPPWRSRSMSLMLSAPATIPATRAATFTSAFAPALPATVTCSSTRSESPADWASSITGTNPPVAIRLSSSNSAEKLWETRTTGAPVAQRFGTLDKSHPRWSQEHPALTTRRRRRPARRIQAEAAGTPGSDIGPLPADQPAAAEQRGDVGVAAPELSVEAQRVRAVPAGEQYVAEPTARRAAD